MTENSLPLDGSIYNLPDQEEKISRKKLLILVGVLSSIILAIVLIISFFSSQKNTTEQQAAYTGQSQTRTSKSASQLAMNKPQTHPLPQVTVGKWTLSAAAVTAPSSLRSFIFLENYSLPDFKNILSGLIKEPKIDENAGRFSATSSSGSDMLYLQKPSGSFVFLSSDGVALPQKVKSQTLKSSVESFVHDMFHENTLVITNEYDKTSTAGVHYYELHRSWESAGLPILSFFGLFNTKETVPFSTLKLGVSGDNLEDKSIVRTLDKTDGLRRPDDFNTVTVGVAEGKVVSIASNARRITGVQQESIITYEEAVARLKANRYDKIYTTPAGEGDVEYTKAYAKDVATLAQVEVTESILTYLEEMPGTVQKKMIPYFVFRGHGVLSSGYRVNVIAAVPATKQNVLGTSTSRILAQATQAATDSPALNLSTFVQTPAPTVQCGPGDIAELGVIDPQTVQTDSNGNQYFIANNFLYIIPQSTDITQIYKTIDVAMLYSASSSAKLDGLRPKVTNGVGLFDNAALGCPVRITGSSPTLFIYSSVPRSITLSPKFSLTYADPSTKNNNWDVFVNSSSSLLVSGVARPYIYYEYLPVTFEKPKSGWIVKKDEIGNFSKQIGKKLGLTDIETQRVASEIGNSAKDVQSSTIFVGIVAQQEVNAKLPFELTQKPQVFHRVHFYISGATGKETVSTPTLKPLERFPFMFLEIGAASGS